MIDFGASFHMTSHQQWFTMYKKYDSGMVCLGDDSLLNIVGCSRVLIKFLDGRVKGVNGVLHILYLAQNLLLVSTLNYTSV
jgi:hypothetical protein